MRILLLLLKCVVCAWKWASWGLWQTTPVEFCSSVFEILILLIVLALPLRLTASAYSQQTQKCVCLSLGCFRSSWCKLTCIRSSSQRSRLRIRAAEPQRVLWAGCGRQRWPLSEAGGALSGCIFTCLNSLLRSHKPLESAVIIASSSSELVIASVWIKDFFP